MGESPDERSSRVGHTATIPRARGATWDSFRFGPSTLSQSSRRVWQSTPDQQPVPLQQFPRVRDRAVATGQTPHRLRCNDCGLVFVHPFPATVLDFGCGTGAWLDEFQARGWETTGTERSTDLAFRRHARLPAIPTEPQFSLVIAYHVLHLAKRLETLEALTQALHPGGQCFLSVPSLDGLATHGDVDHCLRKNKHIEALTQAFLRDLLPRAGIQTLAILYCLNRPDMPSRRVCLRGRKRMVT